MKSELLVSARKATLRSSSSMAEIQNAQSHLRKVYDKLEEEHIKSTLNKFENLPTTTENKNAWELIKELTGKKSKSAVFIEGENRLKIWENHFKNLLNADTHSLTDGIPVQKVFDIFNEIDYSEFSQAEIDDAATQLKNNKAAGLDGLPSEFWKMPKLRKCLIKFCNETFNGKRPKEWGISGLIPIPKKGKGKVYNYRGISLSQVAAKAYNRVILNRVRPVIDKILRPNQNRFRPDRSTSSQLLALGRIVEEIKNYKKEAVIIFIDFRKAFDSIDRKKMLEILEAYGIPPEIVKAIKVMYEDTSAVVITPEGETDSFAINTGVLQGDPLAPFLFIVCLDYALRTSIIDSDGLTLKKRQSRRYPAVTLPDLDFADDIAMLEDTCVEAQDLLHRMEKACNDIGLFLNYDKTKYIHINPTTPSSIATYDGTQIEQVDEFKYLGGYTDTEFDMNARIGQAWGALNALNKIWKAPIHKPIKIKVFKATVQSILLYGSESWALNVTRSKSLDWLRWYIYKNATCCL